MRRLFVFTVRVRAVISAILLALLIVVLFTPGFWQNVYPIRYLPVIRKEAAKAGISPMLVAALVRVESHFREDDVSHAGAIGLMQLMPATASWVAKQIHQPVTSANDLSEPMLNIRLGSWYMAYLLRRFHGRLPEAIAAYNAGPTRVQRWLARGTWSGTEVALEDIPVRETRHFVARVLYTYQVFNRFYP